MPDSGRKMDIKKKRIKRRLLEVLISNKKGNLKTFIYAPWKVSFVTNSPFRYNSVQCSRELIFSLVCYFCMKNVSYKIRRRSRVKTNSLFM